MDVYSEPVGDGENVQDVELHGETRSGWSEG